MDSGIIIQVVLLIVGFVFLIKGSDIFVDGSSSIASLLKVPTIIVGLTIVAFGTSAPEAAVSIISSINGNNAMAVSNIIGSNIFNILIIIGVGTLLGDLLMEKNVLNRDLPILIGVTLLLTAFIIIGWNISTIEGIILLAIIVVYVFSLIHSSKKDSHAHDVDKPKLSTKKSISFIIIGLVGIILGGDLVVKSASAIAISFGMSEALVGLTIVAIGTSLPELVTSLTALKKGENQLVIGNVIGSNIFNMLFVLGASSAISEIPLDSSLLVDVMFMIFITLLCFIFGKTQEKYDKKEGIIFIALFIAYMAFAILRN
ncbi:cation:H+ antiporter [Methanobrevibacter gottschalkii]|uniref:Cation:H+ antiporter n=1 Tax=Methanobrevibacter gottschalkii TaxID=190974 RepID=A0A1H7FYC8_9EURY|nr:calcium/sodium antiporter [Methanobrevibacter gottschalkii]MCQ2970143.1 calcium/sodium antiporter [archaeon]SEK30794.1 cation:H+ antiporter [Methanobrevibacter gottschalkii]